MNRCLADDWVPGQLTSLISMGDRRDVVVVGGGLSGLTAGALLARAGKSVLVVEAKRKAGGYAASIDDGGYQFEPAIHLAMGGERLRPLRARPRP